jgi:hypothetical protein
MTRGARIPSGLTTARRTITLALLLTAASGFCRPVLAFTFHLAVDIPSSLTAVEFTPTQIVRETSVAAILEQETGIPIGALARLTDGRWLIAPSEPVPAPGGGFWTPRDLITIDPVAGNALYLDGGSVGIPEGVRIDALLVDAEFGTWLSFDVPVTLGAAELGPSDLVAYLGGSFLTIWDGEAEGVPEYANLVGIEISGDKLLLTFDVPATLGSNESLPGDIVAWQSGPIFTTFHRDPAWPASSQLRDFVLPPAVGTVPDGQGGTLPLTVAPAGSGLLFISWGSSCSAGDGDYAVYEGTMADFTSHAPLLCSTTGSTSVTIAPRSGDAYYLVVPCNAWVEGSYGRASSGAERPPSNLACADQSAAFACP